MTMMISGKDDEFSDYTDQYGSGDDINSLTYKIVACCIFAIVSFTFLFPCNAVIPLDRRTVAVLGATLCYITRTFVFANRKMDMLHAVDFDVLVLLASIMAINHIVVHLKETKEAIKYMQLQVQDNPLKGFWLVSGAAFVVAPFLTNDGVCLLFVELILDAFEATKSLSNSADVTALSSPEQREAIVKSKKMPLETGDAIYFLLTLACSANIGSALTYTGNPQNMIVAQDATGVLPPLKFLGIMLIPSTVSWLMTTYWIQRCWLLSKASIHHNGKLVPVDEPEPRTCPVSLKCHESESQNRLETEASINPLLGLDDSNHLKSPRATKGSVVSPMSPRRRRAMERESMIEKVRHMVSSPFPYMVLILLVVMIVMIFVDVMPIAALTCISAIVMVVSLVIGNHWRGQHIWGEVEDHSKKQKTSEKTTAGAGLKSSSDEECGVANKSEIADKETFKKGYFIINNPKEHKRSFTMTDANDTKSSFIGKPESEKLSLVLPGDSDDELLPMTSEEKIDNINEFFEELFKSIDYSILLIFMGTFIVVANVDSTGIPKSIWQSIVGKIPFNTVGSVVGISLFVLITSQLLGNVAVVQLAKPNVEMLDDAAKAYAWSVISFVATIGGNLTITGSAANIIVAEKVARLDPNSALDFFRHYKVCFWITLMSCATGALVITAEFQFERMIKGN